MGIGMESGWNGLNFRDPKVETALNQTSLALRASPAASHSHTLGRDQRNPALLVLNKNICIMLYALCRSYIIIYIYKYTIIYIYTYIIHRVADKITCYYLHMDMAKVGGPLSVVKFSTQI